MSRFRPRRRALPSPRSSRTRAALRAPAPRSQVPARRSHPLRDWVTVPSRRGGGGPGGPSPVQLLRGASPCPHDPWARAPRWATLGKSPRLSAPASRAKRAPAAPGGPDGHHRPSGRARAGPRPSPRRPSEPRARSARGPRRGGPVREVGRSAPFPGSVAAGAQPQCARASGRQPEVRGRRGHVTDGAVPPGSRPRPRPRRTRLGRGCAALGFIAAR